MGAPDLAEGEPRSQAGPDVVLPDAQIRASRGLPDEVQRARGAMQRGRSPRAAAGRDGPDGRAEPRARPDSCVRSSPLWTTTRTLIAETLARADAGRPADPQLVRRDERFHGELRRQAEAALAGASSGAELPNLEAAYTETTWTMARARRGEGGRGEREHDGPGTRAEQIVLTPRRGRSKWIGSRAWSEGGGRGRAVETREWRGGGRGCGSARASLDSLRPMTVSALQEDDDAFFARR